MPRPSHCFAVNRIQTCSVSVTSQNSLPLTIGCTYLVPDCLQDVLQRSTVLQECVI